jgi:hypothetical protein
MYYLYPPFFVVPESSNFADAWESFCCKLLNLHHKTSEIYQRVPPEQGVDLFHPSKAIAYQCKSVESGRSGDFNVHSTLESIAAAKRAVVDIGWKKYCLCTNVGITGAAERRLRKVLPKMVLHPKSFWVGLCEEFSVQVRRNFKVILALPTAEKSNGKMTPFDSCYPMAAQKLLTKKRYDVFFWSARNDRIYQLPVSNSTTVKDVLIALQSFFGFPNPGEFGTRNARLSLRHTLLFDGKKLPESLTMKKACILPGSLITYHTSVEITSQSGRISVEGLNIHGEPSGSKDTFSTVVASSVRRYNRRLLRCFQVAERFFKSN